MQNEDESKVRTLTGMAEIFGYAMTDASLEIYLTALEDISADAVRKICTLGLKQHWKFMPKPFEIRSLLEMPREQERTLKGKSAFMTFLDDARRGRKPSIADPVATRALRLVGGF